MSDKMQLKFGPMITPEQASKLPGIIQQLLFCVEGEQPPYIHEENMIHAAHCVATPPTFSFNERECLEKISRILDAHEESDASSYFTINYNKLLLMKIKPQNRHSLIDFLHTLAEKHMLLPESEPESASEVEQELEKELDQESEPEPELTAGGSGSSIKSGIGSSNSNSGLGSSNINSGIGSSNRNSGTGISISNSGPGISISNSGIGSSNSNSGTGISISNSGTAISTDFLCQVVASSSQSTSTSSSSQSSSSSLSSRTSNSNMNLKIKTNNLQQMQEEERQQQQQEQEQLQLQQQQQKKQEQLQKKRQQLQQQQQQQQELQKQQQQQKLQEQLQKVQQQLQQQQQQQQEEQKQKQQEQQREQQKLQQQQKQKQLKLQQQQQKLQLHKQQQQQQKEQQQLLQQQLQQKQQQQKLEQQQQLQQQQQQQQLQIQQQQHLEEQQQQQLEKQQQLQMLHQQQLEKQQELENEKQIERINSNMNVNTKKSTASYQNGNGLCYDPSQQSKGLSGQPLPNYVDILNARGEPDLNQNMVINVVHTFIGIQGKYLKKDVVTGYFKLDPINTKTLTDEQAGMLLRLSELGYYHDRLAKFADVTTGYNPMGIMGQALITKLRQELMEFRGQVAILDEAVKADRTSSKLPEEERGEVTLMSLLAWYIKPLHRMQWLAKIADKCQMLKGGELATTLYNMLDNGNPIVDDLVRDLLNAVCVPLGGMIARWMLEGGVIDLYSEFFVEVLHDVGPDRLWHDKFRLRMPMLPKFVQPELAIRILKTGKSINFLREVCEMQDLGRNRAEIKRIMDLSTHQIYAYVQDTHWHAAVETCYMQTSKHVLDIMVGPHKLLSHLYGMRRYLLLGQGDFVSILIEHMKDELERNGCDIYAHDLSAMLDAALRVENAHHDDPEILNHLDVALQSPFPGDVGWDVISLQYTVHGPLATMLEPTMPIYKAMFKPLWRMKHIEFVLSLKIWNVQMSNAKLLGLLRPQIASTSHRLHLFTSEIMHFIHQMQYYILFEVIECNWVELKKKMRVANSLDEILEAHEKFLGDITVGCFHGQQTQKQQFLETVYESIIQLEAWQSRYYEQCFKELSSREEMAKKVAESEKRGHFGVTTEQKLQRDQECKLFEQRVLMARRNLEDIAFDYEKAVSNFLMALNSHQNPNLQLFGTRLDFNEYYKKRDTNLSKPLTFEHMRLSNVFILNSSRSAASSNNE